MRKGLALPAPSTCPSSPPTSGSSWGCSQGALWLGHHPPELGTVRPAGGCAMPEQRPASSSALPAHSRFGHGCRQRLQARGEHQQLPAGSDAQRELPALVQDSQEQQQPRCLLLGTSRSWVCSYSSSGVVLPFPALFWLGLLHPVVFRLWQGGAQGLGPRGQHPSGTSPEDGNPPALNVEPDHLQEAK